MYVAEIFERGGRAYMQHRLAVGPQRPTAFRISDARPQTKVWSPGSGVWSLESGVLGLESYLLVKHAQLHVDSA